MCDFLIIQITERCFSFFFQWITGLSTSTDHILYKQFLNEILNFISLCTWKEIGMEKTKKMPVNLHFPVSTLQRRNGILLPKLF